MNHNQYRFTSHVWVYPGKAAWYFVTVPEDISEDITKMFGDRKRGWGSLPVQVTIGKSIWSTSIFPDTKEGAYLLPLKKEIRAAESIRKGAQVVVSIEIVV